MKRRIALVSAALLAVSLLGVGSAGASDDVSSKLDYHVADGFMQAAEGIPQTGAVAVAANGDNVRVSGSGTLNTASEKATRGGTFVHTSGTGAVLGFGSWKATGVESATIYPCGGGGLPDNACGGIVVLKVHVSGTSTSAGAIEFDGLLTIDCEINSPTPGVEGIKLAIPGVINFNTTKFSPGGLTVFFARSHP
jgi:hypothetical protein